MKGDVLEERLYKTRSRKAEYIWSAVQLFGASFIENV